MLDSQTGQIKVFDGEIGQESTGQALNKIVTSEKEAFKLWKNWWNQESRLQAMNQIQDHIHDVGMKIKLDAENCIEYSHSENVPIPGFRLRLTEETVLYKDQAGNLNPVDGCELNKIYEFKPLTLSEPRLVLKISRSASDPKLDLPELTQGVSFTVYDKKYPQGIDTYRIEVRKYSSNVETGMNEIEIIEIRNGQLEREEKITQLNEGVTNLFLGSLDAIQSYILKTGINTP